MTVGSLFTQSSSLFIGAYGIVVNRIVSNGIRHTSTTVNGIVANRIRHTSTTTLAATLSPYAELVKEVSTTRSLSQVSALLHWDSMVTMPQTDSHHAARGEQSAALASVIHTLSTSPRMEELINAVDPSTLTNARERANFKLMEKAFRESKCIPDSVQRRKATVTNDAYVSWTKARDSSDFETFKESLRACFDTAREIALLRMDDQNGSVYDKMLDDFETGLPSSRVTEIFSQVERFLPPLIDRVLSSGREPVNAPLSGKFPIASQTSFNAHVVKSLGFHGRSDVSVHPFTTSFSPSDVRITTRFDENEWYQGLAGSVHEAGHALYEGGLRGNEAVDSPLSMGTHESQSLFWERHVGMSKAFVKFMGGEWRKVFGRVDSDEDIHRAINGVKRSFIRVEADELTYPMHILLRTRIERSIVEGEADVEDIPRLWNEGMKELLKVDVPSDDQGCLQDVHWSGMAIGYFPTYLIGAVAAAQLEHYVRLDLEDFDGIVERGEFKVIEDWLKEKVHVHGSEHESIDDLFESQLGERLEPKYFLKYLKEKYEGLYGLN
eukprot:CAMPEP_0118658736 /NCGR_PEP_ID=MMETSP0785-20121206/14731_1 /TAXON_ID=91992 /ORGANISM="Bolidomonas pacifica, Strain CCMP 1866" /LENGTH=550 /DNA_ID=CAMNT_0006551781 /DNA_START=10 /DNA_END=1662 /DNA_ORIENTATION=-